MPPVWAVAVTEEPSVSLLEFEESEEELVAEQMRKALPEGLVGRKDCTEALHS
jgi:hypothetical protein